MGTLANNEDLVDEMQHNAVFYHFCTVCQEANNLWGQKNIKI